jgi:hypothetical protein
VSEFAFKEATFDGMKLLIGLFGLSGGGKTFSALLLARGIAGPNGKVGLIDTENRRGSVFRDLVPGGYKTIDLNPPFHPLRYCEALDAAEQQGIDCVVVDSTSHEWLGEGGYLDLKEEALQRMAGEDWKKREKCAMAAAAQVKPKTHSRFVQKVIRCRMHVIFCFRAHPKVRLTKADGQTKIEVDETPSPMQDGDLIYEMLIAGEVYSRDGIGGFFRIHGPHCKHTHPSVLALLPKDGEQVGIVTGQKLAAWCAAPKGPGTATAQTKPTESPTLKALKKQLWDLTQPWHRGLPDKLNQHLWDEDLIDHSETSSTLTESQLKTVIEKIKSKIALTP